VASEAKAWGYGGVSLVSRSTGISRRTIHVGLRELQADSTAALEIGRVRRSGAGRPKATQTQPGLLAALDALVEPTSRGDPESPLRWTCKGVRRLAAELRRQGFTIGKQKVAELLAELGYSLQGNRKTREGSQHPDRNAQFEYIAGQVRGFQKRGQPVISVDTKKKELVGNFKNVGKE
jgi:transposase